MHFSETTYQPILAVTDKLVIMRSICVSLYLCIFSKKKAQPAVDPWPAVTRRTEKQRRTNDREND